MREAACWMSDIGSHDHPEYRAEQAFFRVLRQPGIALDHHARAFLALTLALRYEAEPDMQFLDVARMLLSIEQSAARGNPGDGVAAGLHLVRRDGGIAGVPRHSLARMAG